MGIEIESLLGRIVKVQVRATTADVRQNVLLFYVISRWHGLYMGLGTVPKIQRQLQKSLIPGTFSRRSPSKGN